MYQTTIYEIRCLFIVIRCCRRGCPRRLEDARLTDRLDRSILGQDLSEVVVRCRYGADPVVVDQHLQNTGGDERRKRGSQVYPLDTEIQ